MKKHLNKLWAKVITAIGMTGAAIVFFMSFFSAWYYAEFLAMVINVACVVVFIPCFSFQLRSAGYWEGHEGLHLTWLDRIPLDLYLCAGLFVFMVGTEAWDAETAFLCKIVLIAMAALLVPSLAARYKAKTLWTNTILYRLWQLLQRHVGGFLKGVGRVLLSIPLVWSALAILLVLSAVDLLFLAMRSPMSIVVIWMLVRLVVILLVLYVILDIRKLMQAGEALAQGDFSRQVSVSCPLPAIQDHADHLNSIQSGLQKAVDAHMQSERLKTELITNVSHDIKTPLTSIVNYVDLLSKTDITDPTALEYIAVLERQAQRLRKLTEDLVEASKAATGNISVNLAPVDLNVLLTQVCAEYEQRLGEKHLQTVFTPAEGNPHIVADGQLLWRVLDNLMGNVCKYAMPGTRVYLTADVADGRANLSLKNISLYPITVSGEELTERFVRGDSSRSTEGSGLGLSIAASLTELQQGTFAIHVDGDLFKAQLTFGVCRENANE
ncbi:MAG: HAMP domain-containing histidine kinase [Ruminococcaceae bacterium]|nr:HAMP domain-containing histidine kinase [Oscillospiraceae bacterium]